MKVNAKAVLLSLTPSFAFAAIPDPGSEFKNVLFADDFNGAAGSGLSSTNWLVQTGTAAPGGPVQWGTGEIESYTNNRANLAQQGNGNLFIIPQKSSSGQWTSARIETQSSSFKAPAGGKMKVQASIRMPTVSPGQGQGYWPAFWMLGSGLRQNPGNWPAVGEIDIMESVNAVGTLSTTMHCGTDPGGVCNEPNGLGQTTNCPGGTCWGSFHTYTLIIDRSTSPEQLHWQLDGTTVHTISQSSLPASVWSEAVDQSHYVILNVAIGGGFPNGVAGGQTPTGATVGGKEMAVDYVAVWTT